MILGAVLLALGVLEVSWMIWAIRQRAWEDHLNLLELGLLKATGEEPELPSPGWGMFQCWLGLLLGLLMILSGIAAIFGS